MASRQATLAAAGALTEAIELWQRLLAENVRLRAEIQTVRQDLIESLKARLELQRQLDAVDPSFLSALGVKVG